MEKVLNQRFQKRKGQKRETQRRNRKVHEWAVLCLRHGVHRNGGPHHHLHDRQRTARHYQNRPHQLPVRDRMGQHSGRPQIRHSALYPGLRLRHLRGLSHRRAGGIDDRHFPLQNRREKDGGRGPHRSGTAQRHPLRCLWSGGCYHPGAADYERLLPEKRHLPAGGYHRAVHYDFALHHQRQRDLPLRGPQGVRGGQPGPGRYGDGDLL